ncbi:MAG: ATP-binding cassette domain-containing protein [Desulfotalea sp.]
MLTIENLAFQGVIGYPNFVFSAKLISFVVGKSGSGKTSLLKLLNKTAAYSSGSVFYHDKDLQKIDTLEYRRSVQLIGQDVFLFDGTIEENFARFYEYRELSLISNTEMQSMLSLCLAPFSLDKHCAELSGGEKQRVFLAIHLSFPASVFLLDEPTSALDKSTGDALLSNIINFVRERKMTMVVVCHDDVLVGKYSDKVLSLTSFGASSSQKSLEQ